MLTRIGGHWLDPTCVTSISAYRANYPTPGCHNRVCIGWRNGDSAHADAIPCDDYEAAKALANALAEAVNEAIKEAS